MTNMHEALQSALDRLLLRALLLRKRDADYTVGRLLDAVEFLEVSQIKRGCPCEDNPDPCDPCNERDWGKDVIEELAEGLNLFRMADGPIVRPGALWLS